MKKTCMLLTICIIFISACSNSEVNVVSEQYKEKIVQLQKELAIKDAELKELNAKIIGLEEEIRNLTYYSYEEEEISWMKSYEWDSIVVTVRHDDSYKFTLPDDLLSISPRSLFGAIRGGYAPPSPSSYTEDYKYIFIKDNEEYVINVYNTDLIEYNGEFYECNCNASVLGDAFLYYPKEIPENSLLRKIYESKLWGRNTDIFRIRQVACLIRGFINDGTVVSIEKPEDIEITENLVEMDFYNKGQKITVYLDESYICIKSNDTEEWYRSVKDVDLVSEYLSAMTAN